ncbi:hypothetical protein OH76DRAFT_653143 [Lentinus brumalis]|uniref:Uncharacterized protein n=1 Tax=Lentinus brumalis TaxID=2498619 RepID=A0A371D7B2_9APHY|nr:hypothetical protein OH76DRAFT_653143 [Polyporus brumalis]
MQQRTDGCPGLSRSAVFRLRGRVLVHSLLGCTSDGAGVCPSPAEGRIQSSQASAANDYNRQLLPATPPAATPSCDVGVGAQGCHSQWRFPSASARSGVLTSLAASGAGQQEANEFVVRVHSDAAARHVPGRASCVSRRIQYQYTGCSSRTNNSRQVARFSLIDTPASTSTPFAPIEKHRQRKAAQPRRTV